MQLSIPVKALRSTSNGFNTKGGTLTSPLILAKNPDQPLEAATKSYLDNRIISISALNVISGSISTERFPQFIGDVTKALGSKEIYLSMTGVVTGETCKVSVNERGRVTASYALSADDIPSLNWTKIKTNTPVSLEGYGITNALSKTGGTLTGFLAITNAPTQSLHVSNKAYADTLFDSSAKYTTGDLVKKSGSTTPSGFLRANGAEISKTTYSALYSVLGDTFSATGNIIAGAGRPWQQQYEFNTTQNSDVTWSNAGSFGYYPGSGTIVVIKNRVHLLYANNTESMGFSGTIGLDGIVVWDAGTTPGISLPSGSRLEATFVVAYGRVYLLGGYDNGVGSRVQTFSAVINTDGSIGTWEAGPNLLSAVHGAQAVVTKNRIYLIGGETGGSPQTQVQTVSINTSGFTSAWNIAPNLPLPTSKFTTAVVKNRIYVLGGYGASNGGYRSTVYMTEVGIDGLISDWTTAGYLPAVSSYNQAFVVKNRLYLMAGYNGTERTARVYQATINTDGSLGTWGTGPDLSVAIANPTLFVTSSRVYIAGGIGSDSAYTLIAGNFTGGLNDYSGYYDGTITGGTSTTFRLPDYTNKENDGFKYFIKY